MRLALLTALTMCAFAANSILTRMAIEGGGIDPAAFALVRVASGALMLGLLAWLRGGGLPLLRRSRVPGALSLALYMIGFSLAYLTLDAGLGALILFGVVQITMFAHGAFRAERPGNRQLGGAAVAFGGLVLALWPGEAAGAANPAGAALMVLAGFGWAAYTIAGRRAADPLAATAANFTLCLPLLLPLLAWASLDASAQGVALAVICGALTSGLGYALWYSVLPRMGGSTAAIVQLSVPVIALLAGAALLREFPAASVLLAAALVVGGIAWAITAPAAPAGRR
jgi:drug/metabolite transporter (DMT)-like permease